MDPVVVAALGWSASALLVAAFWCRDERLLSCTLAAGLATMSVHLGACDAWTAAAGCACGSVRSLAAIRWRGSVGLALGSCALGALLAVPTWNGTPSAIALVAGTATSLTMTMLAGRRMRLALLPISGLWCMHHVAVGSLPALATEILVAAGNAVRARRDRATERAVMAARIT